MKINIKNKFFRNTFELLGNILSIPIFLLWLLMPIIAIGLFAFAIENWKISLPIIIAVCIGIICLNKLYDYYQTKKWKREREFERQAACEFCKGHPNIKHPIRHEILPFKGFGKSLFGWNKFGRAYIKSKGGEQPTVVVYDIEKEVKYNSFGYANKPIDSYEIPIFNMKSDFEDEALVNLEESDIIRIETMDHHTYKFICPKLIPQEEVKKISKGLWEKGEAFCEGKKEDNCQKDYKKAFSLFQEAARMGNAEAQCCLGCCYRNGYGTIIDHEKARFWYEKSSGNGCTRAMRHIAITYEEGQGVPQSYEKAAEWYLKAAEQNDREAQFRMGYYYVVGKGVPRNNNNAVEWYTKAAKKGHAGAQSMLGYYYEHGYGISKNYETAVEWYTKAAELGNKTSQRRLGDFFYYGIGVPKNYETAVKWYLKVAEQKDVEVHLILAKCYEEGKGVLQDYEQSVKWYKEAAEQGNAEALYKLGVCYYKGHGLSQSYEKAVEWYEKSAELGYAEAMYKLGVCYYEGHGVTQNYEEAVKWYKKSAEQGHAKAHRDLGYCYYWGNGVTKSYNRAAMCYEKAAIKGNKTAQFYLAYCYEHGLGVSTDHEEAMTWYNMAIKTENTTEQQTQIVSTKYPDNSNQGIFNYEQKKVIELNMDYHLVLAPPGCGKTRVLAERVVTAVANQIDAANMLCLTFTNRAAREMRDRISNRSEQEVLDKLFVGNVHHFCSTMLRENKVIVQKTTIIDDEEKSVIIRDIIRHCLGLDLVNVEEYYNFQHLLHQVEHHHPEDIIVRPELKRHLEDANFMRIAREYTSYKKKYDLLDFEDLLLYGYDYLIEHKNEVKRYSWIQVDEVQDLNRLQLAIIELVTAPNNPCVVYLGDEQQAIYSFMGAKLSTLSYLKDQCQGNIHHFHGNYRSPKYLLDIFNQYAEFNLHVDKDILPQAQGENADLQQPKDALLMESCELREGFYEYDFCAYDLAVERALSYSDGRTAILTYSNKDCDKISERLAHKNIEHFKISGTDFLWTKEVKLIFSHLNVFTQPENIMSWARILMGIGVCQKLEIAHQLISEANKACLRGNDLLDDARRNLIKNFIHDYPHEFVIFDTETTGLDVNNDDIVEIAAIHISNGIVVDELDLMLYTDKTIPLMLGDIENPLPDEYKKREKKDRKEGLLMFLNWVGDTPVLAHNAKYDYQILDANLQRDCRIDDLAKRWIKVHDSLAITRVIEPNLNSYKLKDLLATFNLQGKNSHLAIDDVKATKSLVDYCYKKANHVFILQNEFYANHREIIAKIKEQYGELYRHTESLLSKKAEEGERNLLATETEYAYHFFAERGFIEELDKMKYLLPFLSEDFIPKEANLSLRQLLDKYMIELNTLRESDLCESKNLKDKVKVYISTVHRAKGLEFENVVVFDVRDGFYPFYEWNNILRDSSDPKERERAKLGIQEDARKLYVAISRAKKRLCIQYPERNTGRSKNGQWFDWPSKPSPFIEKIDFNKKTSITEPSKFGQHDEPSNCDVENRLNSWQTLLEKYKPDWKEVSKRKFKEIECAHISEAVVVPSKYGKSVCFNIIGKGKAFIPLDPIARAEIGDKLNPAEIELVSLKYVGDNPIQAKTDIMRIRIPEKDV